MTTINLINSKGSQVKYELTTFPDGEPHITLSPIDRKEDYRVMCRIANPTDLFILMQVGDILNRQDVNWTLDILYLMSMRMDRVVHFEEAFTLKLVANVINELHPKEVSIFHAHSKRTFELINNSVDMEDKYGIINDLVLYYVRKNNSIACFPDHGARDRYENDTIFGSNHVHIQSPFTSTPIQLKKVRDLENKGAIKSIEVEHVSLNNTTGEEVKPEDVKSIIIIDDLCDAGGTFCWSAKVFRAKYPNAKLAIYVRHLVNPIGLKNLTENFDDIFITNSYKSWESNEYFDNNKVHTVNINEVIE